MVGSSINLRKNDNCHNNCSNGKEKKDFINRILSSFLFIPVIILIFFISYNLFCLLCFIIYAIMLSEIFSSKIKGKFFIRIFASAICLIGIISFVYCRKNFDVIGCGFLICITSFTDTGAYLFGKTLKGPKLCEKISPNKTWAGFFGGIFLANIAFFLFCKIFLGHSYFKVVFLNKDIGIFLSVQCIILASIVGDLLESLFKRKIGVKDTGNLFPGHGGILDRLDSLLLASIVLMVMDIFL